MGIRSWRGSAMMQKDTRPNEDKGRILQFPPHPRRRRPARYSPPPPIEEIDTYARGAEDDFPHRMKTNAAAVLVVILLVICGWWLADAIAQMRKNQDCVLSGRRNCAQVEVPVTAR
jgi:hypothetical protein